METFLSTIAAAALSGSAFLAYRHPEAYARISGYIHVAIIVVIAYLNTWNYTLTAVSPVISKFILLENRTEALDSLESLKYSTFQTLGLPLMYLAFHIFLLILPVLIATDDKPSTKS